MNQADSLSLPVKIALSCHEKGNFNEAAKLYNQALKDDPENISALVYLGLLYIQLEKLSDAEKKFRQAIKLNPDHLEANFHLSSILKENGDLKNASAGFSKIISLQKANEANSNANFIVRKAHCNLANILKEEGDILQAAEYYQNAIKIFISSPFYIQTNNFLEVKKDNDLPEEILLEAFSYISNLFLNGGVKCFPCFGTLLGLIRDGGIIKGDKDIDIGVFINDLPKLKDIIEKSDFLKIHKDFDEQNMLGLYMVLEYKDGVYVDIFIHKPCGDMIVTGIGFLDNNVMWQFSSFDLKEKNIAGEKYLVPEEYGKYLREVYGKEWQKPDPIFDTTVCAPNIANKKSGLVLFYAFKRLYDSLESQKFDKVREYCRQIKAISFMDETTQLAQSVEKFL